MFGNTFIYYIFIFLSFLLGAKFVLFFSLSLIHYIKNEKINTKRINFNPFVSIIVPCCNEELGLENCIKSLINQDYLNYEIIIVDDGSTDGSYSLAKKLESKYKNKIRVFSKANGGKASALNHGLLRASGEIIICIDADSVFIKDTVSNLIKPFSKKRVVAAAGNVKVSNRKKFLNKQQSLEYITGLNLYRRTFTELNCPQVIPGAIGAFRKDKLIEVGGYSTDTIVEDMDVTVSLIKNGGKVQYCGKAIAYTEAPETLRDFLKQRHRWIFGGFQVLKKHKNTIFNPKYNSLGMIGIPYFLLATWLDVLISIIFIFSLSKALIYFNLYEFFIYYIVFFVAQLFLNLYVIYIDKEDYKLSFMSVFESFWYNHLISLVTIIAAFNFIKGKVVLFNNTNSSRVIRSGKNIVPVSD